MSDFRLGIIGTGRMGTARASAFNNIKGIQIKWVCSRSLDKGERFANNYDISRVITDWKEGCRDSNIDGVIITSPNNLHCEMAVFALKQGKHVLIEYPPAVTTDQAETILEAAKTEGGCLHTGLTYRLTAKHLRIQEILKELGRIGTCITLQCSGNPISRWFDDEKRLGNVFVGSCIHFFDELIDWFGPVEWVDGTLYKDKSTVIAGKHKNNFQNRDKDAINTGQERISRDIGSMMINFKKGMTAYVTYARGWSKPGLGFNRKIIGEKGYIVETGDSLEKWTASGKDKVVVKDKDSIYEDSMVFVKLIKDENYSPPYDFFDGLYAVKVAEAAYNSYREGRRIFID